MKYPKSDLIRFKKLYEKALLHPHNWDNEEHHAFPRWGLYYFDLTDDEIRGIIKFIDFLLVAGIPERNE